MRDYLEIDTTPYEEKCQQLGPNYDSTLARDEARAFINQLRRVFGDPPTGSELRIKSNAHDFGSYLSIAIYYVDEMEKSIEYAFQIEANVPAEWDSEALAELKLEREIV